MVHHLSKAESGELDLTSFVIYHLFAGINHNIDELLVGIFSQICLRLEVERRKEMQPLKVRITVTAEIN